MLPLCGCSSSDEPSPEEANLAAVHGSVVIDGEPVNAAAILLTPGGGVKITGSDGLYDFTGLTPGKYELKVFKKGCQTQNSSIELTAGRNEELVFTLAKSVGGLSINKNYIDMGSNESNNVAGFTIKNEGQGEISWDITNAARWITKVEPATGSSPAGGATAVSFTIDRSRLSNTSTDNYATLLVRSTTQGDGSVAELLVTVFGTGEGTNTTNDNSDIDYVMIGDLYVQTKDISNERLDWKSVKLLCENSTAGNFNDWRLPTIEELAVIYNNKRAIGNFSDSISENKVTDNWYFSSSLNGNYPNVLDFRTGQQGQSDLSAKHYARAVRKDLAPEVSILPVSNISESSVTFNGRIDNREFTNCDERGFVYSTSHIPTVEDTKIISYSPQNSADFSADVTNLIVGTTYYIRAYAINKMGTSYSDELSFNYEGQMPTVTTLPVTDIGESTAVLHGSIESKGIPAYTERGFVYSTVFTSPTVENDEKVIVNGTGIGEFSANLSDLSVGINYYARAFATNSEGTSYGETVLFRPENPDYVILKDAGIMVQRYDIAHAVFHDEAELLCENSTVGGFTDWRLPTKEELATMYQFKDYIGNFKVSCRLSMGEYWWYWGSDSMLSDSEIEYFRLDMDDGRTDYQVTDKTAGNTCSVRSNARAVRSLP